MVLVFMKKRTARRIFCVMTDCFLGRIWYTVVEKYRVSPDKEDIS